MLSCAVAPMKADTPRVGRSAPFADSFPSALTPLLGRLILHRRRELGEELFRDVIIEIEPLEAGELPVLFIRKVDLMLPGQNL